MCTAENNVPMNLLCNMINYDRLSENEEEVLRRFLETSYAQAAQSFSQVIKRNVVVSALRFKVLNGAAGDAPWRLPIFYYGKTMSVALTDIMGQARGRSYLLLSDQENKIVQTAALPPNPSEEMKEAFIKELDNMLSAAMISEFSTALRTLVFGGVPHLHTLSQTDTETFLEEQFSDYPAGYHLVCSARFLVGDDTSVQPQFLWKLGPCFLEHLAKYVSQQVFNNLQANVPT
jgi:hypothetical protein